MSEAVEKMLRDYHQRKQELICLQKQIADFHGVSETDIIESMNFFHRPFDDDCRSGHSDSVWKIAMDYKWRTAQINAEWYQYLTKSYAALDMELRFLEAALASLSGILAPLMYDMVVAEITWDNLCSKYHVSRTMVAKYRKKAIRELDLLYEKHQDMLAAFQSEP